MDLPKSLRIGYRTYTVEEFDQELAEAQDCLGECNKSIGRIRVKLTGLDRPEIANILIHEVLHACWRSGDLEAQEFEEKAVSVLANQIAQVWQDNPAFVAFISENLAVSKRTPD